MLGYSTYVPALVFGDFDCDEKELFFAQIIEGCCLMKCRGKADAHGVISCFL